MRPNLVVLAFSMVTALPWLAQAADPATPPQNQRPIGTLELDPPNDGAATPSPETAPTPSPVEVLNGANKRLVANHGVIYLYDHIVTSEGQTVTVQLQDKSIVMIAPSSDITLNQFVSQGTSHGAQILVDQGMVHLVVSKHIYSPKQPFIIRTKTAVMGVRGTEFLVEQLPEGGSTLHTLEGAVSIGKTIENLSSSSSSQVIEAGKMSSMEAKDLKPASPKRFNRKTLFTYLDKRAPVVVRQIEHQAKIRRQLKAAEGKGAESEEKKKKPEWKKPPTRRQVGK